MPLLSANTLVCETVLWEKTDLPTLVRAMSALALGPGELGPVVSNTGDLLAKIRFTPSSGGCFCEDSVQAMR